MPLALVSELITSLMLLHGTLPYVHSSPGVAQKDGIEITVERAKLLPTDVRREGGFGSEVSLFQTTLAVGASREGVVEILDLIDGGEWTHRATLEPAGGRMPGFGDSVSLEGDSLAIGFPDDSADHPMAGSVFVFETDEDGHWFHSARLVASDGEAFDSFGASVSMEGSRLAIGASGDGDNGGDSGSAYIFERQASGTWLEQAKLLALDGQDLDYFGGSLALSGNRLAISATGRDVYGTDSGSVYVFERDFSGDWFQLVQLEAQSGAPFDRFGSSIALIEDRVLVGASRSDVSGQDSGSAYLFERDVQGNWRQVTEFRLPEARAGDRWGTAVALGADRLAIGGPRTDLDNRVDLGAVSLYEKRGTSHDSWTLTSVLRAEDAQQLDAFGSSLAFDGERLAIGVPCDDDREDDAGSSYIFEPVLVSPTLSMKGVCPGEVLVESRGVTPNSVVRLYGSPLGGVTVLSTGPCAGTELLLHDPGLLVQAQSDSDGGGSLVRQVDEEMCGHLFQLVDERTCLTSEVVNFAPLAPRLVGRNTALVQFLRD